MSGKFLKGERGGLLFHFTVAAVLALIISWRIASGSSTVQVTRTFIPLPAECESTWRQKKASIEASSNATVSIAHFDKAAPQYPNLIGFVEIRNPDSLTQDEIALYTASAELECYASSSISMPLEALGSPFESSLTMIKRRTKRPIYVMLDSDKVVLSYNEDR